MKKTPLKKWTKDEELKLVKLRDSLSLVELAKKFDRSVQAIACKLNKLKCRITKKRDKKDFEKMVSCESIEECIKLSKEIDVTIAYIIRERLKSGKKNFRQYEIWQSMIKRCYNDHCKAYPRYGGRGIKVCDEWKGSFEIFYEWAMNNGYESHLTLDRANNDDGYSPNNCRWVTYKVNENNRCNVRKITAFGETKTISEWIDDPRCKVSRTTINWRFYEMPQDFITNEDKLSMSYKEYCSTVRSVLNNRIKNVRTKSP